MYSSGCCSVNNITLVQGMTGPTGLQGIIGPTGLQGMTGPTGLQGMTGPTGLQGPIGLEGMTGPIGLQGMTGPTGLQGPIGLQGSTGLQGPIGLEGMTGPTGLQGPIGLEGMTGPTGLQGIIGPTGLQGLQGMTGPTGLQGIIGPTGPASSGAIGSYGYIYNTTLQVIPIDADVPFNSNGILTSDILHLPNSPSVLFNTSGIYSISFSVSGTEPNQFALFLNGTLISGSIYGSGAGTQQNNGSVIVSISQGDIVTLRNYSSASAVTLSSLIGGTMINVNASLNILRLQ